jgi:hypothetical protein
MSWLPPASPLSELSVSFASGNRNSARRSIGAGRAFVNLKARYFHPCWFEAQLELGRNDGEEI